jgi:DNA (cytosine-5)-methyltransferase 1
VSRPKALDLFCGAGGAGMGLHLAGFDVTGVDIRPQPRYPFAFIQTDALTFPLDGFDLIWASPPCQAWSTCTAGHTRDRHPRLIAPVRERLQAMGVPYIIENVAGARAELHNPVMLCGTMFGLPFRRHRYFECGWPVASLTPSCKHTKGLMWIGYGGQPNPRGHLLGPTKEAMQIDWMTYDEITEAIPPAYSEYLGRQVIAQLKERAA